MPVKFKKVLIDSGTFEAASVFDVNNDGVIDIVCGGYWYQGPDFKTKHKICDVKPEGEYFNDFSDLPIDVNGDGYLDIVTGAWWSNGLQWRENPKGQPIEWKVYDIDDCGPIETTRMWDVDGDGELEIVPNTPPTDCVFYKIIKDVHGKGTGQFKKYVVKSGPSGHGLGVGDINNDGKPEIILCNGWLEWPKDGPLSGEWIFHEEFDLDDGSVPIIVHDVNGDGLPDLISGHAHSYGLAWYEQKIITGQRVWIHHDIDRNASQYHDLQMIDIDGDGQLELITGKRYRAHCDWDPGTFDKVGSYYFKIENGKFIKHEIDFGPNPEATGLGIAFWVADLNGNGRPDIVAPGKDGLYVFYNEGNE